MSTSIHEKLARVRRPRVHITYEVETEGAEIVRELPFVVGVIGDFSGDPTKQMKPFGERKFVQIDRDNFDEVMKGVEPRAAFQVPNTLTEDGGRFGVDLKFRSLEDFSPEAVVEQVEPLRKLLEARSKLADLRNKMAGNDKLEDLLSEVLKNTENAKKLGAKQNGGEDA